MDLKIKAYGMLLLTMVFSALLPIMLSFGKTNINEFLLLVYAISMPLALLVIVARGKIGELKSVLTDWRKLGIVMIAGFVSYFPLEYGVAFAEKQVSAALASVIIRTSPLLMLVLLPIMLHERLTKYQIIALSLGFVGLYIGVSGGNITGVFQNADAGMVLFLIAMAFIYAFSIIMVKKYLFDISIMIFAAVTVMFVIVGALFLASGAPVQALSTSQIYAALFIGIFSNVVLFSLYFYALRPIKATVSANVMSFSPFFSFLFASLILGEPIQIYYIAIALLACTGIAIQSFDKRGSSYLAKKQGSGLDKMTIFDVTGVFANTGEVALNSTIKNGGRILAVKLPNEYGERVSAVVASGLQTHVYTDSHASITEESKFVKDILGAKSGEMVIMKAGKLEECEGFFTDLQGKIGDFEEPKKG